MSEAKADFTGQVALIATMHGKQAAFAPSLQRLGFTIQTPEGFDTDRFGTFSGEVKRQGDMLDAARAKARAAFLQSGEQADWVIASEGAFGPSRAIPMLAEARELGLAWRPADDHEVVVTRASFETNFAHLDLTASADLEAFLGRVDFPRHALIVRDGDTVMAKAVTARDVLDQWVAKATGAVKIETDMRAHLNPMRMSELTKLAERLALHLATPCPNCAGPGFGRTAVETGLPCEACGTPTDLVARENWSCSACGYLEQRQREDARTHADPGDCSICNP